MNLVKAELRRLVKRRLSRWALLAVVLVMGAVAIGVAVSNEKIGPEQLAAAEAAAEADYQQQLRWFEQDVENQIAACQSEQQDTSLDENMRAWPPDFDCEQIRDMGPRREYFDGQWYLPSTFEFREEFGDMITVFAGLLGLYAFLLGASLVGAEWRTGGMMNLLLWRPQRLQVLGSKLGTVLGALLGLGLLLGALWTLAFWLIAQFRGVTTGMTAGAWQSFALTGVRGLVLILAAGAIGFGLASIGRHTAMALGAAVGAVVVGVFGALIVAQMLGLDFPQAWVWVTYLQAWMERSVVLENWNACNFAFGQCQPATFEITWQTSGLALAAAVAAVVGAAMWQMRRRDVT